MPKIGMRPIRRTQLIHATVQSIDQAGLANTTLALVAKHAGISTGIVSHYFGDKNGLLEATMRHILRDLWDSIASRRTALAGGSDHVADSVRNHLRAMIDANFSGSQVSPPVVKTWLAFWSSSMHAPSLKRLQHVNTRRLNSNLCSQFRRLLPIDEARLAASGLAALIDGLWLRGAWSDEPCYADHAQRVAYQYVDLQLASCSPDTQCHTQRNQQP